MRAALAGPAVIDEANRTEPALLDAEVGLPEQRGVLPLGAVVELRGALGDAVVPKALHDLRDGEARPGRELPADRLQVLLPVGGGEVAVGPPASGVAQEVREPCVGQDRAEQLLPLLETPEGLRHWRGGLALGVPGTDQRQGRLDQGPAALLGPATQVRLVEASTPVGVCLSRSQGDPVDPTGHVPQDLHLVVGPVMTLAGVQITDDAAREYLADYAQKRHVTVRHYDYNDQATLPTGSDRVEMGDIARLVIINARLAAEDVYKLLEPVDDGLWAAVPRGAQFETLPDDPTGERLYDDASALYAAFRKRPGIGSTKRTKLLHLKRPGLFPIIDSVVKSAYGDIARQLSGQFGTDEPMFWAAVWRDARANEAALVAIRESLGNGGERHERVLCLPLLRLHDILVWSHFAPSTSV